MFVLLAILFSMFVDVSLFSVKSSSFTIVVSRNKYEIFIK